MTNEIRMSHMMNIIKTLNIMHQIDYGDDWATVKKILTSSLTTSVKIECRTRNERIALEMLLNGFQDLTIYVKGNSELEILLHSTD